MRVVLYFQVSTLPYFSPSLDLQFHSFIDRVDQAVKSREPNDTHDLMHTSLSPTSINGDEVWGTPISPERFTDGIDETALSGSGGQRHNSCGNLATYFLNRRVAPSVQAPDFEDAVVLASVITKAPDTSPNLLSDGALTADGDSESLLMSPQQDEFVAEEEAKRGVLTNMSY